MKQEIRAVVSIFLVLPFAAAAATITVNTVEDSVTPGDQRCALREAIANVNAAADVTGGDCAPGSGGGDTIAFAVGQPAQLSLQLGPLSISKDVAIAGPAPGNASALRIDGRRRTRIFEVLAGTTSLADLTIRNGVDSAVSVSAGATLQATNCALTGNRTAVNGSGGAISNTGTVALTSCTFTRNRADGNSLGTSGGSAIANFGSLAATQSTFSRNVTGAVGGDAGRGAIYNAPTAILELTDCVLTDNRTNGNGAALRNLGFATLTNCTIAKNSARNYGNLIFGAGGGIANSGQLTLTGCALSRNQAIGNGGALRVFAGSTATLVGCTLDDNQAKGDPRFDTGAGGGIANSGTVTITAGVLRGNRALNGGAIYSWQGSVTLVDSTLSANRATKKGRGGGIMNSGTLLLAGSTLDRNQATAGGGLYLRPEGTLTAFNSTVTDNKATYGGNIVNWGQALLTNCTASGGSADNVQTYAYYGGHLTLVNTIIAKARSSFACVSTGGPAGVTDGGHNLLESSASYDLMGCGLVHGTNGNIVGRNALLLPLANNGGTTATMALCTGPGTPAPACTGASPAIDSGDDAVTGPPDDLTTDQRGLPRWAGAHVDIGAYEAQ